MSTPLEIPLQSSTNQRFAIDLAGVSYILDVRWNTKASCWNMDVLDASGNKIVCGLPFVTGADLLEQFPYLNVGGSMYVQSDNDTDLVPTFASLGDTGHLYFVVP